MHKEQWEEAVSTEVDETSVTVTDHPAPHSVADVWMMHFWSEKQAVASLTCQLGQLSLAPKPESWQGQLTRHVCSCSGHLKTLAVSDQASWFALALAPLSLE